MLKTNLRIEIVCSTETRLSSMSHPSRTAILAVLAGRYSHVTITIVNNRRDLDDLVRRKPDLVFVGMSFVPKDSELGRQDPNGVWLSQYLDAHGIAHTGSGWTAHQLEANKDLAKQAVLDAGYESSAYYVARQNKILSEEDTSHLSYPVFIKPVNRGGGLGIDSDSLARNFSQLGAKVSSITRDHQSDSLIENYLPGHEFSVAILRHLNSKLYAAMPIELVAAPNTQGIRILSGEVKASNNEQVLKVTDLRLKDAVSKLALNCFRALGGRDYGRIDIRLDSKGEPHFLEANLLPSLISGYGSFPKACLLNMNLDYEAMVLHIVQLAHTRRLNPIQHISPVADPFIPYPNLAPA